MIYFGTEKRLPKECSELSAIKQNNLCNQNCAIKPMYGSKQILQLSHERKAFLILEWENAVQRLIQQLNTAGCSCLVP